MFATLRRPLFAAALIAGAALLCMTPSVASPVSAAGDEFKDFKKAWKENQDDMEAMERNALADALPADNLEAVEHLLTVLGDKYWTVRTPAINKIVGTSNDEVLAAWVAHLRDKKVKDGVKENIAFGLSRRSDINKDEKFNLLRDLIKDESMTFDVRELIARRMSEHPGPRPPVPSINDNKETQEKIQKTIDEMNAVIQPIQKGNLLALYETLKGLKEEKFEKKNSKVAAYRKLKWSVVTAMETISSQEFDEDLKGWDIFLTQTGFDHEAKQLKDLQYRWREQIDTKVDNVKISGETMVRKKKRRDTNTELILLPQQGYDTKYFYPFMDEFTHYFDVSSFKMPRAEEGTPNAKNRDGSDDPNAYYYPTERVAKAFETRRAESGSDKSVGMFCHGESCFVGMEYAKNASKNAAFLIVVGGWGSNGDQIGALNQCKQSRELELKYYGMINRTYYQAGARTPEDFTDQKRFLGNTGNISHQVSDLYDTEQFVLSSIGRDPNPEPGRRQALIDAEYSFAARPPSKVPALFIWGKDDPMFVKGSDKYLGKYFTNAMFVEMPGVSRTPWLEDPIAFFDHIQKFMEKEKVWERMEEAKKEGKGKKD